MGAGIEEKQRQADCYRAVDEPEGLDLEERRESEEPRLARLLPWPSCFCGRLGRWVPWECLPELGSALTG